MAASSFQPFFFIIIFFFILLSLSNAQSSFRPHALVLPVTKDASTLQYRTHINQRTPLVRVDVVFDLGGQFLWVDCEQGYASSTRRLAGCRSAQCSLSRGSGCGTCTTPGCSNETCILSPDNAVTGTATSGELADDVVAVQSTDGSNPGTVVTAPRFLFSCAPTFLLRGLANGAKGMAGFGRTRIALPTQFAASFSFQRKFAICLSSSTSERGVVFIGDGPYRLLPRYINEDLSKALTYTPLFINPVSTASAYVQGEPSAEYFIGVKSITINDKAVALNTALLSINKTDGYGGTKISTVDPYTVMETSIYKAFTEAFLEAATAMNIERVASVAPFGLCFSRNSILVTRVGRNAPIIGLVLQSERVVWRIHGVNSLVEVSSDVLCLGFVDGGSRPRTSIVIGGRQLEDNLLQFDLAASRLGFTESLAFKRNACSNFNFTSIA